MFNQRSQSLLDITIKINMALLHSSNVIYKRNHAFSKTGCNKFPMLFYLWYTQLGVRQIWNKFKKMFEQWYTLQSKSYSSHKFKLFLLIANPHFWRYIRRGIIIQVFTYYRMRFYIHWNGNTQLLNRTDLNYMEEI